MSKLWRWCRETFELGRGNGANVRSMEGMRGLAVTAVFCVHYATLCFPYVSHSGMAPIMEALHQIGNAGVDLFFVLSGYLIYGAALKCPPYFAFMKRRIRRIYPAFLAVFSIYVLLSFAMPHESKIPAGFWPALSFLVQNALLLPGIFPIPRMIPVAWSLSYEMLYYIVIPALVSGLALYRWRRGPRIALLLSLAALGALAACIVGGPVRAIMFLGGAALYDAKDRGIHWPLLAPIALIAAFASMLLPAGTRTLDAMHAVMLLIALTLFCFACFSEPASSMSKRLSARPIRWLGNMSYSYYLLHGVVLKAAFLVLMRWRPPTGHEAVMAIALLAPLYLITIVASAMLFASVERPFSLRSERHEPPVGVLN
jgi:peptidoglycan/LPS O-acetylase OafA/YrhL